MSSFCYYKLKRVVYLQNINNSSMISVKFMWKLGYSRHLSTMHKHKREFRTVKSWTKKSVGNEH